ncbi:MAG: hypothetical protein PVJ27_09980, partial [Candidatus Brocadiaceae bacterium]
ELHRSGVYVTHDEFKGLEPARRGSATFHFSPEQFDNPRGQTHFSGATSGSTGTAKTVRVNFGGFREREYQYGAILDALGPPRDRIRVGMWVPPTYSAVAFLMKFSRCGSTPVRWFSQVPLTPWRRPRLVRLEAYGLTLLSRLFGVPTPLPRRVPVENCAPVLGWITSELSGGRVPCLVTYASSAVRVALEASRRSISLAGTCFLPFGESITAARRRTIEGTGAACVPLYGTVEHSWIAGGCRAAVAPDDMHVFLDTHALIAVPRRLEDGQQVNALAVTDLTRHGQKVALNVETGDCGVLERRECGCPWAEAGLTLHLRDVWSYSRLTPEGLTFEGTEVFRILEEVLPAEFGGRIGDYQLIAEPGATGVTRYVLAVDPALGEMDEEAVRRAFLRALGRPHPTTALTTRFLEEAGQLKVVRQPPEELPSGKALPVLWRPPKG